MIGLINERHILQIWKETELTQVFCEFLNFMGENPPMVIDPAWNELKFNRWNYMKVNKDRERLMELGEVGL